MACFWNGILKQLRQNKQNLPLLLQPIPNSPSTFVKFIQSNNVKATNVEVNGIRLTEQQINETQDAIKNGYSPNKVNSGTLVSTFDPVLILLCQLSEMNINHKYMNNNIQYTYIKSEQKNNKTISPFTMNFGSNSGHFWG